MIVRVPIHGWSRHVAGACLIALAASADASGQDESGSDPDAPFAFAGPAAPRSWFGHHPRRRGPGHGASHPHYGADTHRWPAGRGHLQQPAPDQRFHPAGSDRGGSRHRKDRGLAAVRRSGAVRGVPGLGEPARSARRQRDAPRQQQHLPERPRGVPDRPVLRPPQRHRAGDQRHRRTVGRPDLQRAHRQRRLEPDLGVQGRAVRGRLDRRDGRAVQVPALPARTGADLGLQRAPDQQDQERDLVSHAGSLGPPVWPDSSAPRWRRRWSASRCRRARATSR